MNENDKETKKKIAQSFIAILNAVWILAEEILPDEKLSELAGPDND